MTYYSNLLPLEPFKNLTTINKFKQYQYKNMHIKAALVSFHEVPLKAHDTSHYFYNFLRVFRSLLTLQDVKHLWTL